MHIGLEKTEKINLARVKPARDRDRLGCFIPHPSGGADPGILDRGFILAEGGSLCAV